jgi:hypothetical protein
VAVVIGVEAARRTTLLAEARAGVNRNRITASWSFRALGRENPHGFVRFLQAES